MRRIVFLAIACVVCAVLFAYWVSGGSDRERARTENEDAVLFVLYDISDVNDDRVVLVSGQRACAQARPCRTGAPWSKRIGTGEFPTEVLLRIRALAAREGLKPPFEPGGVPFTLGVLRAGSSDIEWRHFDTSSDEASECFAQVLETMRSLGQALDAVPPWLSDFGSNANYGW